MNAIVRYRQAEESDALHLAALVDCASRGLIAWWWSTLRQPGQSIFEVGRHRIRTKTDSPSYYKNWTVAEVDGEIVGGLLGYRIPQPFDPGDISDLSDVHGPVLELEEFAAGTWYIMTLSVFAEYRGQGLGTSLLKRAEKLAQKAAASRISLSVESSNTSALRLYIRRGFVEWARRPYVPFPGSTDSGDWILLKKEVA